MTGQRLLRKHNGKVVPDPILWRRRSTWILVVAGKEEVAGRLFTAIGDLDHLPETLNALANDMRCMYKTGQRELGYLLTTHSFLVDTY